MTPEEFQRALPFVRDWISDTLATHASKAKPVSDFSFPRLGQFYDEGLLDRARVVFVDRCPVPPLSALGLHEFEDFENMNPAGITYLNTYFALWYEAERESLHFHELVHVIQWNILGFERFLACYAEGIATYGYRQSPLEVMAYDHQNRFESGCKPYSVESEVRSQLRGVI